MLAHVFVSGCGCLFVCVVCVRFNMWVSVCVCDCLCVRVCVLLHVDVVVFSYDVVRECACVSVNACV